MSDESPDVVDLDYIAAWVLDPQQTIHPDLWFNTWNWLIDLARSLGVTDSKIVTNYEHASEDDVYDKLFFGNNIPVMNHNFYAPAWSDAEINELRAIFQDGLDLFDQAIQSAPD